MVSTLASSLLLLAAACGGKDEKPLERPAVTTATTIVAQSTIPATRAVAGTVRSESVSPLAAKVIGNVTRVDVSEGDRVRAGQLLAVIDAKEARARVEAADSAAAAAVAQADLAESTFRRYSALRERRSVSAQELDDVKARRDAAVAERDRIRAMTAEARAFFDESLVRAPIDGIVTARFVDPGAQAAPGMPLLTIEDPHAFRVEAMVPEELAVHAGDPVTLRWGDNESRSAKVTRVQPGVDPSTRSALVQIALSDDTPPTLRSGSYVRVQFRSGERTALTVPPTALVRSGQLTSVFVVGSDGVARMRLVTLTENGEILSGVDAGERVVVDAGKVQDGTRVISRDGSGDVSGHGGRA